MKRNIGNIIIGVILGICDYTVVKVSKEGWDITFNLKGALVLIGCMVLWNMVWSKIEENKNI